MRGRYIVGVDEVGRGPLAGPVTVGAVLSRQRLNFLRGVKDSKKLSPKQREEWLEKLKTHSLKNKTFKFVTASVGSQIIDRVGITAAARVAVGRCLKKLEVENLPVRQAGRKSKILLDGSLYAPRTYPNQKTIIKGDEKIPIIAAASIIAKLHRDKKMTLLHDQFPEYGFDEHKGYGTSRHIRAIKKHGLSPLHRRSFCRNIKLS